MIDSFFVSEFHEIRSLLVSQLEDSMNSSAHFSGNINQTHYNYGTIPQTEYANQTMNQSPTDAKTANQTEMLEQTMNASVRIDSAEQYVFNPGHIPNSEQPKHGLGRVSTVKQSDDARYQMPSPLIPTALFKEQMDSPGVEDFIIDLDDPKEPIETDGSLMPGQKSQGMRFVEWSNISDNSRQGHLTMGAFVYDYLRGKYIPTCFAPLLAVMLTLMGVGCLVISGLIGSGLGMKESKHWLIMYCVSLAVHATVIEHIKALVVAVYWTFSKRNVVF